MSTIHVVSHTHWDREWYLAFQRFRFRLVELIDQLLALLEADPDYRSFMLDGQMIVLEDYLEIRPEREAQIRRYVQEGRLLIGPWYILPDEFLVSPEATVRNLLVGGRVCRRFGPRMGIGYIPDPFGHVGQMPQILCGIGIDVTCLWRGVGDQPTELCWRAPNGSEVLLLHLRDSYSNGGWLPDDEDGFVRALAELRDSLAPHATTPHVLVMHGMDHMRPRADLPRLLAAADAQLEDIRVIHSTLPGYLSAVRDELGEGETRLRTVEGELRSPQRAHLLPGVLSTRMWIKQRNHGCQTLLEKWAEPFSAIATHLRPEMLPSGSGGAQRHGTASSLKPFVDRAWRYLLENHPHDSICGCSVDQVHREMVTRFDWCEQIGQEATQRALRAIAQQIELPPRAVVVFNPDSAPRTDLVSVEIDSPLEPDWLLLDEAGRRVAYRTLGRRRRRFFSTAVDREGFALLMSQFESGGGRIDDRYTFRRAEVQVEGDTAYVDLFVTPRDGAKTGSVDAALERAHVLLAEESIEHYRIQALEESAKILFVARDVPPLGYVAYTLGAGSGRQEPRSRKQPVTNFRCSASNVENEYFRVEADPDDGTLVILDKTTGRVLEGCNRFVDGGDRGDEYNYCRPEHDWPVNRPSAPPTTRLLSADEVGVTLETAVTYLVPASLVAGDRARRNEEAVELPIVTRVTLTPGVRRVDFETTVENRARDHRLRVHFPTGLHVDAACADGHFEVVERPLDLLAETEDWAEQPSPAHPQRAFVDVSDGEHGVTLANRGLPEYEVVRGEEGAEIALTLLRCVGWLSRDDMRCRPGHAGPGEPTPGAQCLGQHTFRYSLIPHRGDYRQAYALAYAFQTDPRALAVEAWFALPVESGAAGLPSRLSFVTVEPSALEISAVKEPEEGQGLIVRCWNVGADLVEGTIRLWRPFRRALRVNLAEEGEHKIARDADAVTLAVRGWEVVTVRFEF